jgi:predicted HTH domain antitoxin
MSMLSLEIPDDILLGLQQRPEDFAGELRLAAAVKWYEMGRFSQAKAAEIAGMSRAAFLEALGRFGVSPFQESAEDVVRFARETR